MMYPPMSQHAQPQEGMDPRQRIVQAMMQRMPQPKGNGILGGLNQAARNGLQMFGMMRNMKQPQGTMAQQPDPVMGTGYPQSPQGY